MAAQAEEADHLAGLAQRPQGDAAGIDALAACWASAGPAMRGRGDSGGGGLEEFATVGTRARSWSSLLGVPVANRVLGRDIGGSPAVGDPAGVPIGTPGTSPRGAWYTRGMGRPAVEQPASTRIRLRKT